MQKLYTKIIDGKKNIKRRNQIVIVKDGFQYVNPSEEMIFSDGWEEYIIVVEPEVVEKNALEDAINKKLAELTAYDSSEHVNIFYYNGYPIWLDKATRVGLMLRIDAEYMNEKLDTSLWYNGYEFPIKTEVAKKMLYAIEIYASKCYDNTQRHATAIKNLKTIEEVENYNFKDGYPHKLEF